MSALGLWLIVAGFILCDTSHAGRIKNLRRYMLGGALLVAGIVWAGFAL